MTTLDFDGDVVVVTGAGGGMGRTHALELARRGARVVVNDLGGSPFGGGSDPGLAEAVVGEIRAAGGEAVANTESVATPEGGASLTEQALSTWGRLDAVVSNAAIVRDNPFDVLTFQDFDDVLDVNLRGALYVLQPAYKAMKAAGGGRIVAVTSLAGLLGSRNAAAYNLAKSAAVGLVRTLALEGEPHNIKANLLSPGALGTRMQIATAESQTATGTEDIVADPEALDRFRPERVSPMVSVLTHRSCPCTGQILNAWYGAFSRATVTVNRGWLSDGDPTAEDVIAHWNAITTQATAEDPALDAFAYAQMNVQRLFPQGDPA